MATSLVKVNGAAVSVEDSGRTVVNVNICQESSPSYLVKAVAAAGWKWPGQKAPAPSPGRALCTGEPKVLGGVQILLGITCFGFWKVLSLFPSDIPVMRSDTPFWMGNLFVVSGFWCMLSGRGGGRCWVLLATFFNLAGIMAGCVGLALSVADLPYLRDMPYWIDDVCQREGGYRSWRPTWSPSDDRRVEACKDRITTLLSIVSGLQSLLLIFAAAALGIVLSGFLCGSCVLRCSLQAKSGDWVTRGDPEVPPQYEEPAKEKTAD